jgi:hypothetical protein
MPTDIASLVIDDATRARAAPAASWGAILAGAAVAVSLSLILVALGAGLGFASISPWLNRGVSAGSTVTGAIWLIVTQWLSAAAGGYVAGRLRHRWLATHTHEVFFRDTAHGLVTWCVATLVLVAVLAGSLSSLAGGGIVAAGSLASNDAYDIDKLFRNSTPGSSQTPDAGRGGNDARMEVMHITANAVIGDSVSEEDRTYLTNLVAAKTGISTEDAQRRLDSYLQSVKEATLKAKAEADKARKAAASAAIYTALSMLIGAFIASVAAVLGGHLRDEHL